MLSNYHAPLYFCIMKSIFIHTEKVASKIGSVCGNIAHPQKVTFMHIPKCAGTSIMSSLRDKDQMSWAGHIDGPKTRTDYNQYMKRQRSKSEWNLEIERELYQLRQALLIEKFNRGYPVITGHVPFIHTLKLAHPNYYFFTVVRSPISRFLSAFNYDIAQEKEGSSYLDLLKSKGIDYAFDQYIDSERAVLEGNLLIVFLGEGGKEKLDTDVIKEKAYQAIDCFDFIGLNENMKSVAEELRRKRIIKSDD